MNSRSRRRALLLSRRENWMAVLLCNCLSASTHRNEVHSILSDSVEPQSSRVLCDSIIYYVGENSFDTDMLFFFMKSRFIGHRGTTLMLWPLRSYNAQTWMLNQTWTKFSTSVPKKWRVIDKVSAASFHAVQMHWAYTRETKISVRAASAQLYPSGWTYLRPTYESQHAVLSNKLKIARLNTYGRNYRTTETYNWSEPRRRAAALIFTWS